MDSASGCRSLCWTQSRRRALASAAAKAGDLLLVLWDGQILHVWREKGVATFISVENSYVHEATDVKLMTDGIGGDQAMVLE